MNTKEFKTKMQEAIVFENEKDKALICANNIRNKYCDFDIDFTTIYARLVKYQIATYGETINDPRIQIKRKSFR